MPLGLLLATNVIYVSLVLISLVEKDGWVGFCFLIGYVNGITHVPTSLSVGPTPFPSTRQQFRRLHIYPPYVIL
jgi:hypothetical protein